MSKQKTYIVEKTVVRELPEMERPERLGVGRDLYEKAVIYENELAAYNEILSRQPTFTRGDNGFWKEGQIVPASEMDLVKQYKLLNSDEWVACKTWEGLHSVIPRRIVAIPKQKEGGEEGMQHHLWQTEKPEFTEECLLIIASFINRHERYHYSFFQITKLTGDDGWYWGVVCDDGDEWGDLADLHAEKYMTIPLLNQKSKP